MLEIAPQGGLVTPAIVNNFPVSLILVEPDPDCQSTLQDKFPNAKLIMDDIYHFYQQSCIVDTVVCFGLLYHLHSPIYLIELIVNQSNPEYIIFDNLSTTEITNSGLYGFEEPNICGNRFAGPLTKKVAKINNSIPLNVMNQAMDDLGYEVDWVDKDIKRFRVFSKFGFVVGYKRKDIK